MEALLNCAVHNEMRGSRRVFCWDCRTVLFKKHKKRRRGTVGALLERDGNKCAYCKVDFDSGVRITVDHVIPRSRGGSDKMNNKVLACYDCNQKKGNMLLEDYIKLAGKKKGKRL